jgi:hypothetical protein
MYLFYLFNYISCFIDSSNSPYGSEYKTCQCNIIVWSKRTQHNTRNTTTQYNTTQHSII